MEADSGAPTTGIAPTTGTSGRMFCARSAIFIVPEQIEVRGSVGAREPLRRHREVVESYLPSQAAPMCASRRLLGLSRTRHLSTRDKYSRSAPSASASFRLLPTSRPPLALSSANPDPVSTPALASPCCWLAARPPPVSAVSRPAPTITRCCTHDLCRARSAAAPRPFCSTRSARFAFPAIPRSPSLAFTISRRASATRFGRDARGRVAPHIATAVLCTPAQARPRQRTQCVRTRLTTRTDPATF